MMPVPVQRSFTNVPEGNAFESDDVRWPVWAGSDNNLPWADILKSERVLIIAQAGSGKSHECRQCQKRLWEAGEPAFFLELGTLATTRLEELLLPEEETRLQEWRTSQSLIATFFLDSVDELAMTHGSFRTALTRLKRALGSQIARARIVITSRPVPVDRQAVEEILPIPVVASPIPTAIDFANIVMGLVRTDICAGRTNLLRTVLLLPLSDKEIEDFAVNLGVTDPERLLQEIHRRNAKEFAERPLDLIGLCSQWRQHGRIGSHREQVASDVRVKLRPAADRAERAPLSEDKAFEGATRLALAATLMRRLTFRHSAQADIGGWRGSAIDPAEILPDWSAEERVTLLQRPLFGFASYGRVRFHHRSVVEYLAAARLAHHISCGVAVRTIKRLLFTKTAQGEEVVRPTLRPVATWLALENEKVFVEMCRREPGSLLELGDPGSMSLGQKKRALSAYVERYGGGGWRGLNVPAVQVRRFAEPHLATHIAQLWPTVENPDVRDLLLELVAAGPCPGCADMAYDVVRSPREPGHLRLTGLDALICMSDRRLGEVMQALESDPSQWPNEIARPAVVMLFPSHLTAERLLSILRRLTDRRNSVSHLNYFLPQRILGADMDRGALTTLRQGLVDLVSDGIKWERNWPHYRSSRPFLIPALGAACVRQFGSDISGMALSVSLVLRVAGQDFESDQPMKALRALVADADGVAREQLFWAEDDFRQLHHPVENHMGRLIQVSHHGPLKLGPNDDAWVMAALRDTAGPVDRRKMMLFAAAHGTWDREGSLSERSSELRRAVAGTPELEGIVEGWSKPVPVNAEAEAMRAEWEADREKEAREKAEAHASWARFWQDIADTPDVVFAGNRATNTAWSLWNAMSQSGQDSRDSGWNRAFLEGQFGRTVADRMRETLRGIWRADRPTLRSEREAESRNSFLAWWQLGLAAIAAEAEDIGWANKLTSDEARLACRYVPIQLNGFPSWLDSLAAAHPLDVEAVLGGELDRELRDGKEGEFSWVLQGIGQASDAVASLFQPRLRQWLDEFRRASGHVRDDPAAKGNLKAVLGILMRLADVGGRSILRDLARQALQAGLTVPWASAWLPLLMKLDPNEGTAVLEHHYTSNGSTSNSEAAAWIASLFGDRSSDGAVSVNQQGFTPRVLLRLVRLAYSHIRPEDDVRREGSWTPDARDHAEQARNTLLGALLDAKGPDGWAAKTELAATPFAVHMRDRVMFLAREHSAGEVDGEPVNGAAVLALESRGEMAPVSNSDMFQLMNGRLDDLEDLMLADVSPREGWALFADERVMRRALAHELDRAAHGAYNVDQEAVTADEKETDIRLRSTVADRQGVIELKIGDKGRSAAELKSALKDQLVGKYMASETCRAGCLLITLAEDRSWRHPEGGHSLDFNGLIEMLNEEAARLNSTFGGEALVAVRGLDLRPRLASERSAGIARS